MAVVTEVVGTRTSVTSASLGTLASATYCESAAIVCSNKNKAVEVSLATTNTPSGNLRAAVFVRESLDGSNYRSGPVSGTTTTRERNLLFVGFLPVTTASTTERMTFDIKSALGYIPYDFTVVVKNDLGVALTTGTIFQSDITPTIT